MISLCVVEHQCDRGRIARYCARASVTAIRVRERATPWYSELRCIPQKSKNKSQGCDLRFTGTVSATTELYSTSGWWSGRAWGVLSPCISREILVSAQFRPRNQIAPPVQVRTLQCRAGVPTYYLAKFTGTPGSYNSCKHYNVSTMSHL
jgi:hypothetical protein